MVVNKNYNSSEEEEEWDLVPEGAEVETAAQATESTEEASSTEAAASLKPSALLEEKEEVSVGLLAEQQTKLGITNETTPDEIQNLMEGSSAKNENLSVTSDAPAEGEEEVIEKEDTPLLAEPTNHKKDEEEKETTAETPAKTEAEPPAQATNPNQLPAWLRTSLQGATQIWKDVEQKHDITGKTRQSLTTVGTSLRQVGNTCLKETEGLRTSVTHESRRLSHTVQQKAQELDVPGKAKTAGETISRSANTVRQSVQMVGDDISKGAKTAGDTISRGAKTAGVKAKELNKDGKVTDLVAAAAVIGAAGLLIAKGKPGAGAAVLAGGGAAYMAASETGRQYEDGLNEDLHMD